MTTLQRQLAVSLPCLALAFVLTLPAVGETLDTLHEYGDAATTPAPNAAGRSHGADFSNAATNAYAITAGGEDFWAASDHGTFISDSMTSRAPGENFSAVVRSVSVAADPLEVLAGEWGRTGVMARKNPNNPASANVAHIRKTGGAGGTLLQGRPSDGAGTDRNQPVTDGGYFNNTVANTLNGSVRNTPIWLGLHRYDGVWYATWADDAGGSPGTWSDTRIRSATSDLSGEVWLGLCHHSHRNEPHTSGGNTAEFDNFSVGAFDNSLGVFPDVPQCEISFTGEDVYLTAGAGEPDGSLSGDVGWRVEYIGDDAPTPGGIRADIYLSGNSAANRDAMVANTLGDPDGSVVIPNINWTDGGGPANGYPDPDPAIDNSPGPNLFAQALPGLFGGNQDNYGVHLTGDIFIPSDADRGGVEAVRFHDGNDDYTFLEIDGSVLINQNSWTGWTGTDNNGGSQGTLDVSASKYDAGAWVPIRAGMWEGGGGDRAVFTWDALDRTGADSATGATDGALGSYNPTNLADGPNVSFVNDPSDVIPSANLRTLQPGVSAEESGFGAPNMQLLPTTLAPSTRELRVFLNGVLAKTVPTQPFVQSAAFTARGEVTLILRDVGTGATRDIDTTTLSITRNGMPITPPVTKEGLFTTIIDTLSAEPFTHYAYAITGSTTPETDAVPFTLTATVRSHAIRETLRAGLPAPPNAAVGWDYMEFDAAATLGRNLGGGEQSYRDAQDVIRDAATPLAAAPQPYINHSDPDTSANSGDWIPDLPILSDDPGGDDQYVTLARTTITIAAGEQGARTFRIRGDDGYGLRITGASFVAVAGNATNMIDPLDPSSAFFPSTTGDSNAFLVCNFPTPGDYLVEFFAFEGGGGSYQEISWAPGFATALNQSSEWALLGDSTGYVSQSVWGDIPASVLPPLPTEDGGWAVHLWYDAQVGNLLNTLNYLRGIDAGTATFSAEYIGVEPFLDHRDDANGGAYLFPNDLPFPGDPLNPGDTQNIAMIAHARLVAPVDGDYSIQIRSDDGFLLRFLDPAVQFAGINSPVNGHLHPSARNEIFHPTGTGDTNTRAWVNLAAGTYDVVFVWWEGGGGSSFEISSAPGIVPTSAVPPYELLTAVRSTTNLYLGTDEPPAIRVTEILYDQLNDEFTLTWTSQPGKTYAIFWSRDAKDWGADVNDSIFSVGETTSFGPFPNPVPGAPRILFRAQESQ